MKDKSINMRIEQEALVCLAPITFLVLNDELKIVKASGDSVSVLKVADESLVNRSLCHVLGCCTDLASEEKCIVRSTIENCFARACKQESIVHLDEQDERDDRYLFLTVVPLPAEPEQRVLLSLQDVTAWRQVDEAFQNAQRFRALGTLAGGIAHDFNNLLTTIIGKVSLVRAQLGKEFDVDEQLQDVLEVAFKASDLADELLTFAAGGAPSKEACSVTDIVEEALRCALVPFKANVSLDAEAQLPQVAADFHQMKIALSNLLVNCAEAIDSEGQIRVSLKTTSLDEDNTIGVPSGDYVSIEIADNGPGIPVRDLCHVCEPYFTTKSGSHGLGLTAACSIVQRHGGQMCVKSRWREGTLVTVHIPVWREIDQLKDVQRNKVFSNRILIMDDDETLRDALTIMLEYLNWEVTAVSCGEEAIEEYSRAQEEKNPFKLVILDLIIRGGMGGDETVRRLTEIDPNLLAVVSSGYSNSSIMADYKKHGFSAALPKPYSLFELDKLISQFVSEQPQEGSIR
jgi:two-component system cell cycle sensor histidine kinase/response regulator CckA